jgi:aspartyl-tRNA(Asn)/glutamyl-tRNA(Gln) amidotransferase subunit A
MWTVAQLGADLAKGTTTSRELVEEAFARIVDPAGEGSRAFMKLYADSARGEAEFADRQRKVGVRRSPVDGLPISVKDLFDVAGDVTRAGSKIFEKNAPARVDAPALPEQSSSAATTWSSSRSAASA